MTREETKKAMIVMEHFENGGKVEVISRDNKDDKWQVTSNPTWNWAWEDYRIKPKAMKVTAEEMEAIKKSIVWTKGKKDPKRIGWVKGKDRVEQSEICKRSWYILNLDTMEWEDWSGDTERLRHHYNGGQP